MHFCIQFTKQCLYLYNYTPNNTFHLRLMLINHYYSVIKTITIWYIIYHALGQNVQVNDKFVRIYFILVI